MCVHFSVFLFLHSISPLGRQTAAAAAAKFNDPCLTYTAPFP